MSKKLKWDVKRGNAVYGQVDTEALKEWIKKSIFKKGDVEVRESEMCGWCRPENLDEFKELFI